MSQFVSPHRIVLVMFVVTACSRPQRVATRPALVELQPLTISFRGEPIAKLFADGRTESAGQNAPGTVLVAGPTIHADGTIEMTKPGVTARIDDKGNIFVIDQSRAEPREQLFGHISGNAFAFSGSERAWDVRVEGNLIEFGEQNSSQIDGDVTASMRHAALVMAAAFYIEGALTTP